MRVQLLGDLRDIFASDGRDAEIVECLGKLDERPWPEYRNGRALTPPQLAKLLAVFNIRPSTIRDGMSTPKGYKRSAFADAWTRYLPPEPPHRHNPQESASFGDSSLATTDSMWRIETGQNPKESATCGGVADGKGGSCAGMANPAPSAADEDTLPWAEQL